MGGNLNKREELLEWKRSAGRWLSLADWGGPGAVLGSHRFAPRCAPLRRSEVLGRKGRPVSARLIEMRIKGSVRGNVKLKCEPAEWAAFCIHGPRGGQFQMGRCQDRHARLTT